MDPSAIQALLEAGPWGITALCVWRMLSQEKKIDDIRQEQIRDTKLALDVVAKSTDRIEDSEARSHAQTEASKELVAMMRVMLNKGQIP